MILEFECPECCEVVHYEIDPYESLREVDLRCHECRYEWTENIGPDDMGVAHAEMEET